MPGLTKLSLVVVSLFLAVTLTLLSSYIERTGPQLAVYGNLCGPSGSDFCYKPVLKGGFPLAYLFDAPGISVERQLGFGEDRLVMSAFALDIAIYFLLIAFVIVAVPRRQADATKTMSRP